MVDGRRRGAAAQRRNGKRDRYIFCALVVECLRLRLNQAASAPRRISTFSSVPAQRDEPNDHGPPCQNERWDGGRASQNACTPALATGRANRTPAHVCDSQALGCRDAKSHTCASVRLLVTPAHGRARPRVEPLHSQCPGRRSQVHRHLSAFGQVNQILLARIRQAILRRSQVVTGRHCGQVYLLRIPPRVAPFDEGPSRLHKDRR